MSTLRVSNLQADLRAVLQRLARPRPAPDEQAWDWIRRRSENLERLLDQRDIGPDRLTQATRQARGWLALFAQREWFERYRHAAAQATAAFEEPIRRHRHLRPPVQVWFMPMRPPARIRLVRQGALLQCRTPMITFDADGFAGLADLLMHRRSHQRQALHERASSEAYQSLDAELEALGGVVEHAAGKHHDLAEAFERVNRRYFGGTMARPRLTWSRTLTRRKFGHYDLVHDTLMVSATLDQPQVPAYVVDYLVYHELLHKHHGIRWHNGRAHAHTSAFRADEQRFARFTEAQQALDGLASQAHGMRRRVKSA